ncbi:MAG: hypothetical protein QMD46_12425 [Methanomicrobiales archaeon]|nr:hypothetical protein [Methanomicrobiales archaeon]
MTRGRPPGSTNSPESVARTQLTKLRNKLQREGRPPTPEEEEKIRHWETVVPGYHRTPAGAPPVEEEVPKSTSSEPYAVNVEITGDADRIFENLKNGLEAAAEERHQRERKREEWQNEQQNAALHVGYRPPEEQIGDGDLEDRLARKGRGGGPGGRRPLSVRLDGLEEQIKDARYDIGMLTRQLVKFSERLEQHDHPPPEILQQLVSGDQALRKWVENQEAEIRRQLDTIEDQHRQDLKRVEDTIAVTDGMHYVADILKEINKNLQKLTKAVQGPGGSP